MYKVMSRNGVGYFRHCATIFDTKKFFPKIDFFGNFRPPAPLGQCFEIGNEFR